MNRNKTEQARRTIRSRIVGIFPVLLFACALAACSVKYGPSVLGSSGYTNRNIDATTVIVNFTTGATAHAGTARDYALYRCAELTQERGYEGFAILKDKSYSIGGQYGYTTSATITMRMFKWSNPPDEEKEVVYGVYDAAATKMRLEPIIER